jgi:hypothetical protein
VTQQIATHDPAPDSNFVIQADLSDHGMPGRSEQLWTRQLAPHRFLMRSLPFFVYGVALNDEVETDERFALKRVVQPSGHRLLRVASVRGADQRLHEELHPLLEQLKLPHEWHGYGYVAVDVEPERNVDDLLERLQSWADEGFLAFEMA